MQINVYDRANKRRLLGSVDTRKFPTPREALVKGAYSVSMACMTRPLMAAYRGESFEAMMEHSVVHFEYAGLEVPEGGTGWTEQRFMVTDSPLKALMLVPEFRLPGETDAQHSYRTGRRGY